VCQQSSNFGFVISQEPRPVRQSKSARWPSNRSRYLPPGNAADQPACSHSCDTDQPDTARRAAMPAWKRSLTALPKDRTLPEWQDGSPVRTGDKTVRVYMPHGTAATPSLNVCDSGSSKKGGAHEMMEISKTGEDEVEQDRNTVKYAAESESHITDLAAPADPMYSFTEQENAPEQQLDGNVE